MKSARRFWSLHRLQLELVNESFCPRELKHHLLHLDLSCPQRASAELHNQLSAVRHWTAATHRFTFYLNKLKAKSSQPDLTEKRERASRTAPLSHSASYKPLNQEDTPPRPTRSRTRPIGEQRSESRTKDSESTTRSLYPSMLCRFKLSRL